MCAMSCVCLSLREERRTKFPSSSTDPPSSDNEDGEYSPPSAEKGKKKLKVTPSIPIPIPSSAAAPITSSSSAIIREESYRHDGGIKELVCNLCADKLPLHPEIEVISCLEERKGVAVELALRWSKDMYIESLTGFANGIRTPDGGSHLDGAKAAITKTINTLGRQVWYGQHVSLKRKCSMRCCSQLCFA